MTSSIWGGSVMLRRRPLMGSRRTHLRRHSRRGRGIWDSIKSVARTVGPVVGPILRDYAIKVARSKLGVGRRRTRRRRTGGNVSWPMVSVRGCRRRRRRTGSAMISGARRHRSTRRGRGPIGSVAGSIIGRLLGNLAPF